MTVCFEIIELSLTFIAIAATNVNWKQISPIDEVINMDFCKIKEETHMSVSLGTLMELANCPDCKLRSYGREQINLLYGATGDFRLNTHDEGVNNPDKKKNISRVLSDKAIFEIYNEDGWMREKAKEYAIIEHQKFVSYLIYRLYPTYADRNYSDMLQCGMIGILKALDKYNGKMAFTTYSRFYIIHELSEYICYLKGTTAHFMRIRKKIMAVMEQIEGNPDCMEIAKKTNIPVEKVRMELFAIRASELLYLEESGNLICDTYDVEEEYLKQERDSCLENTLRIMDRECREIVLRRVLNDDPVSIIAKDMGLTSRMVKYRYDKGMDWLRTKLKE